VGARQGRHHEQLRRHGRRLASRFPERRQCLHAAGDLGKANTVARGDWNVLLGYKRIEPDALPDAYNDSTFHLGGTNARGYYLGGAYAIDKNTWFSGRWTSSREVFGSALSIDTLQIELNARF
jgi:hypothetical protein